MSNDIMLKVKLSMSEMTSRQFKRSKILHVDNVSLHLVKMAIFDILSFDKLQAGAEPTTVSSANLQRFLCRLFCWNVLHLEKATIVD
jgi:hypothetical protein